jgi:hypothetical protein
MQRAPSSPVCDVVACEICLREIPRDLAHSQEGVEYVHYFCGSDCYAQWQEEAGKTSIGNPDKP